MIQALFTDVVRADVAGVVEHGKRVVVLEDGRALRGPRRFRENVELVANFDDVATASGDRRCSGGIGHYASRIDAIGSTDALRADS